MKLSQARSGAAELVPERSPMMAGQLEQIERRLAEIERRPVARTVAPPPAFDQQMLDGVVNAVEERLKDQEARVERRISETDLALRAELKALREQDDRMASAVEIHTEKLQDHFIAQVEAVREDVERVRTGLRDEVASAIEATSVLAVAQGLGPIRAQIAEKERELADLRRQLEESDSAMQDLLNGIGAVIRKAADRESANGGPLPSSSAPAPAESNAPLPSFAEPKPSRPFRLPLVSSMAVTLFGIALLYYL